MNIDNQTEEDSEFERHQRDQSESRYYTRYCELEEKFKPFLDVIEGQDREHLYWLVNHEELAEALYRQLEPLNEVYKVKVEILSTVRGGTWRVEVVHDRGAYAVKMWFNGTSVETRPC